jgi:hypothetical protein
MFTQRGGWCEGSSSSRVLEKSLKYLKHDSYDFGNLSTFIIASCSFILSNAHVGREWKSIFHGASLLHSLTYLKLFSDKSNNLLLTNLRDSKRSPWKVSSSTFWMDVWVISMCLILPRRNSVWIEEEKKERKKERKKFRDDWLNYEGTLSGG